MFIGRPLSYSTSNYDGYSPFANNKTLVKAHFGNPVNYIYDYLFYGCSSLKTLVYNSQCKPTTVGNYAFWGCAALTESDIHYPESVKTIGEGAFGNCTSLTSYTIPSHVTTVGLYAFRNCTRLAYVVIKPSVTSIGTGAFNGCTSMTGVTIEESEETLSSVFIGRPLSYSTSNYDGYSPFANNKTLVKAHFGNPVKFYPSYLFYGCTSLATMVYNSQFKPTYVGSNTFSGCTSLTWNALNLPQTVTDISSYAFVGCTKFTNVVIKPSVTSIGTGAFNGCTSMTGVTIEESEETLSFIGRPLSYSTSNYDGYSPFANNKTIVKARLGKKLSSIPNYLFYGCSYLNEVMSCAATPPSANANCFANYDATLYVPKGSVSAYKNATVWKDFYSIIGIDIVDDVIPGDVNGDGKVNITDVTDLIDYLLSGDASAINLAGADCNQDGSVNISDVTALIDYLLSGHWN